MTKEEKWLANYKSFKEYVEAYAKIPDQDVLSMTGSNLLSWFRHQRHTFNTGSITPNKVDLLNRVVPNILEKPIKEINLDMYLRYHAWVYNKYDPEVIQLYKHGVIDYNTAKYCISTYVYRLSDIVIKLSKTNNAKAERVFYNCIQTVCKLPEYGVCHLYYALSGEENLFSMYLKNRNMFIDYESIVLNNFKKDYKEILKLAGIGSREIDILNMYFGLEGYSSHTLEGAGKKYDLERERVRQIIAKTLRRMRVYKKYDSEGICSFRNKGKLSTKSTSEKQDSGSVSPYTANFEDYDMLSTRAMCCLKRRGIYCFKDLHEYLVSLYRGADCDYSDGLMTVRNMGRKSAEEIILVAEKYGLKEKVFNK